ncbi:hypothetical protein ACFQLX_23075, partial [Streptomyces polyrhachis]
MTSPWRRWSSSDPKTLIEYVQRKRHGESTRGTPADILGAEIPAPGDAPPIDRVRALYEAFAGRGIVYADEPTTSDPGRQTIRPPCEVLKSPRHGTCLDLAVTFAGACLDAGLHPLLLITQGSAGGPAHALVAVWLDGNWSNRAHRDYRINEADADWQALPEGFLDELADSEEDPGAFVAVDVTGAASRSDAADPLRRRQQTWAEAVSHGAELVRQADTEDRLNVTLDIGLGYEDCEPLPLPDQPRAQVLTSPYLPTHDGDNDRGPLKLLWARHDTIRFHPRDELDFLMDWFQAPDPDGPRPRIALIHGIGGAGKTRLAAELAHLLGRVGWYAGFLVRNPDLHDCAWLGRVASPLLLVVDYADDHKSDDIVHVLRTLRDRQAPTCLILTARSVSGWWEEDVANALRDDNYPHIVQPVPLPPRPSRQTGVYRAALRSFGVTEKHAMGSSPPQDPGSGRWTTLDLVMLAWLVAEADVEQGATPTSESALYEKILQHELDYWIRAYKSQIGKPSRRTKALLREAGACLSLLAPRKERLNEVLNTVVELAGDAKRRDEITALLEDLLPTTPEDDTIAVRPDPIGTHLIAGVFSADDELLGRCLKAAEPDEQLNACVGVSRLSTLRDPAEAASMAFKALHAAPDLWSAALAVAATHGGPFVSALEQFAADEAVSLPLAKLAATLPLGHSTLRRLALIATERSRPDDTQQHDEAGQATLAGWYNNLSNRQSDAGDRQAALDSITEAV